MAGPGLASYFGQNALSITFIPFVILVYSIFWNITQHYHKTRNICIYANKFWRFRVQDPISNFQDRRSVFLLKNAVQTWAVGVRQSDWLCLWYFDIRRREGGRRSLVDWSPHGRVSFPRLFHHQGSKHANLKEEGGGRGSRVGVWLFGPALFWTHFDRSTVNDQNGGFSVESPLSKFHTTGLILWRVHISKCLHFCRSLDPDRVWSTCGAAGVEGHPSNSPLGTPCLSLPCPEPHWSTLYVLLYHTIGWGLHY